MKVLFIRSGNRGVDPISQNQGESLLSDDIQVDFYDIIGKGIKGYMLSIRDLRKHLKINRPDIVHAHYSYTAYAVSLTFIRIPLVVSLMGSDVNTASKIQQFIIKYFILFFWDAVIVKSSEMKKKLGYKKAYIIPNGVNLEKYKPIDKSSAFDKLAWDKNKRHILFASDPNRPEKNYSMAKLAIDELKDDNIEIHFLMNIQQSDMPYYYCAADCLLLTSFYEGSPNVIKEAMACNCPIVSTDVGDVKQLIEGIKGCYLTKFDKSEIAEKLKEALIFNNRTMARDSVKHLDSKEIAKKLISIYQELLKS